MLCIRQFSVRHTLDINVGTLLRGTVRAVSLLKLERPVWHFAVLLVPRFGHMLRLAALVLLTSHSLLNNVSVNCVISNSCRRSLLLLFLGKSTKPLPPELLFGSSMHQIVCRLGLRSRLQWQSSTALSKPQGGSGWLRVEEWKGKVREGSHPTFPKVPTPLSRGLGYMPVRMTLNVSLYSCHIVVTIGLVIHYSVFLLPNIVAKFWRDYFHRRINPFKPSGVKWLHFKVFRAILI